MKTAEHAENAEGFVLSHFRGVLGELCGSISCT